MTEAQLYWYWFCNIKGVGRKPREILLKYFKHPREIYFLREAHVREVLEGKIRGESLESILNAFSNSLSLESTKRQYAKLEEQKIRFLSCEEEEYPKRLKNIYDYPYGLYVKGKLPKENKKIIAIVGARKMSVYGREMARIYAKELARNGIVVVSGLARGIDTSAHEGSIEGGGETYGVLGCGINRIYPRENFNLFQKIEQYGGILSEYGLNEEPLAYRFPRRNRIISGMSDGVFVIEAGRKSGSLITAELGLQQGREIFALPGRVSDCQSEGCNLLIQGGAKLVQDVSDILEEMGVSCEKKLNLNKKLNDVLANREKIVYYCLSLEPKYIDDIAKDCSMSIQETMSILFSLELNGYIKQIVQNYYIISV